MKMTFSQAWLLVPITLSATCAPSVAPPPARGQGPQIVVSADTPIEGGTEAYGSGVTAYHWAAAWDALPLSAPHRAAFFARTGPGVVLLDHRWPAQDALTAPDAAQFAQECAAIYGGAMAELVDQGRTLLLEVSGPPRWTSSLADNSDAVQPGVNNRPIWGVAPPLSADGYGQWAMAFTRLGECLRDLAPQALAEGRLWVSYLSEPNYETFYGPVSAIAPSYGAAALALKAVDERFRVGGITPSQPWSAKESPAAFANDAPLLPTWLQGCRQEGFPIDFITTHMFTASPVAWGSGGSPFDDAANAMRGWLADSGYDQTDIVVTDWTTWELNDFNNGRIPNHPWLSSEHDTEYRAAHLAAGQVAMQRSGFSAHTLGTLFEQAGVPGEFIGDWGLVTNAGVAKPSLNALSLTASLAGSVRHEVVVTAEGDVDDSFTFVEAGSQDGTLAVLVARFVPDTSEGKKHHFMLAQALGYRLTARGQSAASLCRQGLCSASAFEEMLAARSTASLPDLDDDVRTLFHEWFALDEAAVKAPLRHEMVLTLDGLPPSATEVRHFRVGATAANSFNHCVVRGNDCTDVAAVNAGPAALAPIQTTATGGAASVTLTFEQERHQVDLFVVDGIP